MSGPVSKVELHKPKVVSFHSDTSYVFSFGRPSKMLGVGIVHWSHHINHLVYKLHCKPATSSHSVSLTSAGRFEDTQRCSKSKDSQFLKVRGELKSRTMDYTVLGRLSCMQYISCFLFWSNTLTRSLTPSLISHWNYPCFHIWENVQIALLQPDAFTYLTSYMFWFYCYHGIR